VQIATAEKPAVTVQMWRNKKSLDKAVRKAFAHSLSSWFQELPECIADVDDTWSSCNFISCSVMYRNDSMYRQIAKK